MKVSAEDRRQVAQVVGGVEYRARGGYFEMPDAHAKAHLIASELPTPSVALPVGQRAGYRCAGCGFGTFFRTCSRCGGSCEREASATGAAHHVSPMEGTAA